MFSLRLLSLAVLLAAASGCAATDPYERVGIWRPNGANDINRAAMIASPSDLVHGVGDGRGNAQMAAAAVDRLRRDAVKPLPASGIAEINVSAPAAAAAAPAAGAAPGSE